MKFIRLDEYRPTRSAEVLDALSFYAELHKLASEIRASKGIVTASVNMLKIRLAQMVGEKEGLNGKNQLLLGNLSDELQGIKQQYPDEETQKRAIAQMLFGKDAYWKFLMEYLYTSYLPKLEKTLQRGFNGLPGVDQTTAEEIGAKAITDFMDDKDKASLINTLSQFDTSKGTILKWIEGGLLNTTKQLIGKHFKTRSKETSTNVAVGDTGDMELGDMLQDGSGEKDFDVTDYAEKADRLLTTFSNYARTLTKKLEMESNPANKFKLKTLLENMTSPENNVGQKIRELKELGDELDTDVAYYDENMREAKDKMRQLTDLLNMKNPDQNLMQRAPQIRAKLKAQYEKSQQEKASAIANFDSLYKEIEAFSQYDEETGATRLEPEPPMAMDAQAPNPVAPNPVAPNPVAPNPVAPANQPIIRTKARGNKTLLSPAEEEAIRAQFAPSREKILPYVYKATRLPKDSGDAYNPNGLFNLGVIKDNIKSKAQLQAIQTGDFSQLDDTSAVNAIYASIVVKAMLEARDQQIIDREYDREISDSALYQRAKDKFENSVLEAIQTNPTLQEIQQRFVETHGIPQEGTPEFASSPQGSLLQKLETFLAGADLFRKQHTHSDYVARGASYEAAKDELFGEGRAWNTLSDEERQKISEKVYEDQYSSGVRPFHVGKPGQGNIGPRYPLKLDLPKESYLSRMNSELQYIGNNRSKTDWYNTEDNPEYFRYKAKPNGKNLNPMPETPQPHTEAQSIESLVRLASAYDKVGEYYHADRITNKIKRLLHG